MSAYMTLERIAALRNQAQQHRDAANDSPRYEVYFAEMQTAASLDGEADQLEHETIEVI
jgi:hypothetical protein